MVIPVVGYGTPQDDEGGLPPEVRALAEAPGWGEVDAVRSERMIPVDANLFGRPGPYMARAARYLAQRLHPEAFAQVPERD